MCSQTLFEAALVPEIHLNLHDGFWGPHSSQLTWSRGAAPHLNGPNPLWKIIDKYLLIFPHKPINLAFAGMTTSYGNITDCLQLASHVGS